MTRKQALAAITAYVAMGDRQSATRIYLENRISMQAFNRAAAMGRRIAEARHAS